jgi:thymidine kinase
MLYIIAGGAGSGKSRELINKCVELGNRAVSMNYFTADDTAQSVSKRLTDAGSGGMFVELYQVSSMTEVIERVEEGRVILIDGMQLGKEDFQFLHKLSEYLKADVYVTSQTNRSLDIASRYIGYNYTQVRRSVIDDTE